MTSVQALKDGINDLLDSHPSLRPLPATGLIKSSHTKKTQRYTLNDSSFGIGHVVEDKTITLLWVPEISVSSKSRPLIGITPVPSPSYKPGENSGRHSNLEVIPGFRYKAALCYEPKNLWEAARIIQAFAGY
ncbi:hypothetical protein GH722_20510 [Alphaproteobacteria bacterium HT1-32]|nr:hypothetical protein [Alphaproteobacteria bacterium HT1-32]